MLGTGLLGTVFEPLSGILMAATFGLALSLVLIAGSELFTGNAMIMGVGALSGRTDWDALARSVSAGGTLVILMGVGRLADNVAALRAGGVAPDTPVAMVERASRPDEFAVTGTLDTITDRAREVGIDPPAVTVVGDVVSVRDRVADALRAAGTVRSAGAVDDPAVPTE